VVTICTASLTFNNSTFCPHSVFMCFVWIWEQTAIISLYNTNWLVCVTETECLLRGTDWMFIYILTQYSYSVFSHSISRSILTQYSHAVFSLSILTKCSHSIFSLVILSQYSHAAFTLNILTQYSLSIFSRSILTQYSRAVFSLNILTQYSLSIFSRSILSQYSHAVFSLNIFTQYSLSLFSRSILRWYSVTCFLCQWLGLHMLTALKSEGCLNNITIFSFHLIESTKHLHYEDHPVNAV
jgi:hypothetical protein